MFLDTSHPVHALVCVYERARAPEREKLEQETGVSDSFATAAEVLLVQ